MKRYVMVQIIPSKPNVSFTSLGHSSLTGPLQMASGKAAPVRALSALCALSGNKACLKGQMIPPPLHYFTHAAFMTQTEMRVMLAAVIQTLLTTQTLQTNRKGS